MIRILILCAVGYLAFLILVALFQRKLLYLPSHDNEKHSLSEWRDGNQLIGYARLAPSPETVWLFLHGNAGQAGDRDYVLPSFTPHDSVYILEYPGYGSRPGSPSRSALNSAAALAYELLRRQYPDTPVCVAAESIGSGPASYLATSRNPPDKIVLITPFDKLSNVAQHHYRFLPVSLLMLDNWDNSVSLTAYNGEVEIFAAKSDRIIPIAHAKKLAESKPSIIFNEIEGDHNDWSYGGRVQIRYRKR